MTEPERTAGHRSPTFSAPPLVEVALGVQFVPIAGFGATVMAGLAERWRGRYPQVQEHPPLPPTPPLDAGAQVGGALTVNMGAPQIRLWLLNDAGDRLVQLQRDRIVVNWRLATATDEYPRYDKALRPEFEEDLRDLLSFLDERDLPASRLIATEVTYVNRIPDARPDLVGLLRSQSALIGGVDKPDRTRLFQSWVRRTPDGGLLSTLQLTVDSSESSQCLLTLTGRSPVGNPAELDDVLGALDVCHDDVVTSFVGLTVEERHAEWGRKS